VQKSMIIALAGNPNSGKTTIFNELTGMRQHVGNYPGVTVEKRSGELDHRDYHIEIIDLPGIYSLTAFSEEEIVSRDFIMESSPDVIINIIDSSNLERNLYLTVQLLELGVPIVLDFNMADAAKKKGMKVDKKLLSELLGMPIVETIGPRGDGIDELLDAAIEVVQKRDKKRIEISYGDEIENELEKIIPVLSRDFDLGEGTESRWFAVKLLERDSEVEKRLRGYDEKRFQKLKEAVSNSINHINNII